METTESIERVLFKREAGARSPGQRFLIIFLPALLILLLISGYLIFSDLSAYDDRVSADETVVVVRGSLREAVTDTLFLATLAQRRNAVAGHVNGPIPDLLDHFTIFAKAKASYRQVRLIDIAGVERARVNYDNGVATVVGPELLQRKTRRYYVVQGLKLNPGQIYISRFDLNVENGVIEKPLQPMVRIVAPVFGDDGARQGMVVTNVDGHSILDGFTEAILPAEERVMLVDQHGFILRGADEEEAWAFMFNRPELSLAAKHPLSWKRIEELSLGQFEDDEGLWTFHTIYPVGKTLTRSVDPREWSYRPADYNWKVISFIPHKTLVAYRWERVSASIIVALLLLLTLAVGSWMLARTQTQLVEYGTHLEETVEKRTAELRAANVHLSQARVDAEMASEAKSQFLANMSHELRTPLNAISGFTEIMEGEFMGPIGNETYKGYIADIGASAKHLTGLIQDLIDISQIEANALALREQEVEVAEIVGECLLILSGNATSKGVTLCSDMPTDAPKLRADATRIRQIVLNLLTNAVKFTPKDGVVTLSARVDDAGAYHLRIADTGVGIADSIKDQIFKPFTRAGDATLQSDEGVGLGLAITHSLIVMHGGTITVESEEGVGTVFEIVFPPNRTIA